VGVPPKGKPFGKKKKKKGPKKVGPKRTNLLPNNNAIATSEKFFENMMHPQHAFVIPRIVPTEVAPHHYTTTITLPKPPVGQLSGAVMIQPSLTVPAVYLTKSASGAEYDNPTVQSMHHVAATYSNKRIDYDEPLVRVGGGGSITASSLKVGYTYYEEGGRVIESGAYYKADTFNVSSSDGLQVTNRGSGSITVQGYFQSVFSDGSRGTLYSGTAVVIASGATGAAAFAGASQEVGAVGFAFGATYQYVAALDQSKTINVNVSMFGKITIGVTWEWQPLDFFANAEEGSAALADFQLAESYCVTGFSSICSNTAPAIQAGGSIRACQLPGGTRFQIPGTPEGAFTWLGNRSTRRKMENIHLTKGNFYSYRPEKIQDFMFRQHPDPDSLFLYGDKQLPYCMIAYTYPTEESAPLLQLTININLEYITNSNVAPKWMSPCDSVRLMELWIGLGSEESNLTENPQHMDAVKRWTKQIFNKTLGNPEFRSAALKAGTILGTLALA
jgi:hypothetical protein